MVILGTRNKITDFLMILAWASPFNKWRYVDTSNNPADDITRGTPLSYLCQETRWSRGPPFLVTPMNEWPNLPIPYSQEDCTEC